MNVANIALIAVLALASLLPAQAQTPTPFESWVTANIAANVYAVKPYDTSGPNPDFGTIDLVVYWLNEDGGVNEGRQRVIAFPDGTWKALGTVRKNADLRTELDIGIELIAAAIGQAGQGPEGSTITGPPEGTGEKTEQPGAVVVAIPTDRGTRNWVVWLKRTWTGAYKLQYARHK